MKDKYLLQGKLKASQGHVERLSAILIEASELVSKAKGCHLYLISRSAEADHIVYITEIWDSKEDHDNSLKLAGVRELIGQAIPLLDGQPQKGDELEGVGGFYARAKD